MSSTVRGWELVCPWPIGIGPSKDARIRARRGRNHDRGVAANASATGSVPLSIASILALLDVRITRRDQRQTRFRQATLPA